MTELEKAIRESLNRERVMNKEKVVTYDDTRDVAITIVEYLIDNEFIKYEEGDYPFEIQDEIHDEVNSLLGLKQDEVEQIKITNKNN
jgi:hypothetical protein